eukprot:COSAG02_NODE_6357_length_3627_cov_11.172052_5_plen_186_part_00
MLQQADEPLPHRVPFGTAQHTGGPVTQSLCAWGEYGGHPVGFGTVAGLWYMYGVSTDGTSRPPLCGPRSRRRRFFTPAAPHLAIAVLVLSFSELQSNTKPAMSISGGTQALERGLVGSPGTIQKPRSCSPVPCDRVTASSASRVPPRIDAGRDGKRRRPAGRRRRGAPPAAARTDPVRTRCVRPA